MARENVTFNSDEGGLTNSTSLYERPWQRTIKEPSKCRSLVTLERGLRGKSAPLVSISTLSQSNDTGSVRDLTAEGGFVTINFVTERNHAPVAQLDRVTDYESGGRRFESCRARHFISILAD